MRQYAVIGNPVDHSLSPIIHKLFAEQTGQLLCYDTILAPFDQFKEEVTLFVERGGNGLNVTLPFKQQAFEMATKKSQAAIDAQAVNTLVFHDDGLIEGCNTDGMGLIQDLTHNHHYSLHQKRILILGAGGAVRGIVAPLLEQAPGALIIANRTKEKAARLAEQFELLGDVAARGLDELDDGPYDLIIHGTSVRDEGGIDFEKKLIGEHTWCYDLNYDTKQQTPFVRFAQGRGAQKALDGSGMLVEQAAASFYIWHGVYPDTSSVLNIIRES
jgi:shikimate dehydrogenase